MSELFGALKDEKSEELIKRAETQLDGAESYIRQLEKTVVESHSEKAADAYVTFMVHLADLRRDLEWLSDEL